MNEAETHAEDIDPALKNGLTNVSTIYFKDLKLLIIPPPPIAAQKAIAEDVEKAAAAPSFHGTTLETP